MGIKFKFIGKDKGQDYPEKRPMVLVMDEIDGISSEDKGGIFDLIQNIRDTKVPIICICNDKYNQRLSMLRTYCFELEFGRPYKRNIIDRMLYICKCEGLQVNLKTIETLIEVSNFDIRLILGHLQLARIRDNVLTHDQINAYCCGTEVLKDVQSNPFTCAHQLLTSRIELKKLLNLKFEQEDLISLLVQENYLDYRSNNHLSELQNLKQILRVAEAISKGDTIKSKILCNQNWNLLPFAILLGIIYPTNCFKDQNCKEKLHLQHSEKNFPRFTQWLGHNSSETKNKKIIMDLYIRIMQGKNLSIDCSKMRTDYLPVLKIATLKPLMCEGKIEINSSLSLIHQYQILKEDIEFIKSITTYTHKISWYGDKII